jgi:hypothetical protein
MRQSIRAELDQIIDPAGHCIEIAFTQQPSHLDRDSSRFLIGKQETGGVGSALIDVA